MTRPQSETKLRSDIAFTKGQLLGMADVLSIYKEQANLSSFAKLCREIAKRLDKMVESLVRPSAVPPPDAVEAVARAIWIAQGGARSIWDREHLNKPREGSTLARQIANTYAATQGAIAAYTASQPKGEMMNGMWYLGAKNDGLFIIDRPPQPAPMDFDTGTLHDVNVIVAMPDGSPKSEAWARVIISAHNATVHTRPAGPGLVALPDEFPAYLVSDVPLDDDEYTALVEFWTRAHQHFGSAPSTLVPLPEKGPLDLHDWLMVNTPGLSMTHYQWFWEKLRSRFSQPAAGAITKEEQEVVDAAKTFVDESPTDVRDRPYLSDVCGKEFDVLVSAVTALRAKEPT